MAISKTQAVIGRVFYQRCFYLFLVLLAVIAGVPFIEPTPIGRFTVNLIGILIMIASVAAVGRTRRSFVIVLLLAVPAITYHWMTVTTADPHWALVSSCFTAVLYTATLAYLLQYVFEREVMTIDRLFGAAAAYLLIGVSWSYFYSIVDHFYPGSFAKGGTDAPLVAYDYLYFSFTVLTSTGFGDIVPILRQARSVCVVEQVIGTLFLAILIARLAGVYPPTAQRSTGAE
jgi:hypothetical protein